MKYLPFLGNEFFAWRIDINFEHFHCNTQLLQCISRLGTE